MKTLEDDKVRFTQFRVTHKMQIDLEDVTQENVKQSVEITRLNNQHKEEKEKILDDFQEKLNCISLTRS